MYIIMLDIISEDPMTSNSNSYRGECYRIFKGQDETYLWPSAEHLFPNITIFVAILIVFMPF